MRDTYTHSAPYMEVGTYVCVCARARIVGHTLRWRQVRAPGCCRALNAGWCRDGRTVDGTEVGAQAVQGLEADAAGC